MSLADPNHAWRVNWTQSNQYGSGEHTTEHCAVFLTVTDSLDELAADFKIKVVEKEGTRILVPPSVEYIGRVR